ncbi:LysR substrate-binding domain-containing protein [Runella sp. MFBS21]|uniref:hydrogen peroxide-inducible genes activator n=1 Tax=Runella sp. MFBS21 TaxID=3034018 RepID=UPI0023F6F669|nr:hydrogen peroxide-inducible genes activator [Runella sp. MFBS21]MDF7819197.1 LysR substrate-binding domain-containing protein [Runella sp. MFBS21]
MTFVQLEYLVALDTYRHFATAAENCFVTQPTLSMQIQKLEDELGVKLFDRSKQPVVPTEIGEAVIRQARILLREALKTREIVDEHRGIVAGEIRVGIIPTLAPYLLPLFLANFIQKYPHVKVKIKELTTENLLAKLNKDLIDVGIVATPLHDERVFEEPLFYEEFVAYVSEDEAAYQKEFLLSEDIDLSRLWLLEEGHCFRGQILNICELRKQNPANRNFEYESGSIETLKRMVESYGGVTILPELSLTDLSETQLQQVRQFHSPKPIREVSLVTLRHHLRRGPIEAMKSEILAVIPEKMKQPHQRKLVELG